MEGYSSLNMQLFTKLIRIMKTIKNSFLFCFVIKQKKYHERENING